MRTLTLIATIFATTAFAFAADKTSAATLGVRVGEKIQIASSPVLVFPANLKHPHANSCSLLPGDTIQIQRDLGDILVAELVNFGIQGRKDYAACYIGALFPVKRNVYLSDMRRMYFAVKQIEDKDPLQ